MAEGEMVLDRMDYEIETAASAEILVMELGESYSDEDAERVLADYEALHHRCYIRPSEALDVFTKRASKLRKGAGSDGLDMDRGSATALLRQLREMAIPADTEAAKEHKARVHGLEDKLGVARTDFTRARPASADAEKEAKKRFMNIQFERIDQTGEKNHLRRHVDDRIALVGQETMVEVLHMVIAQDEDGAVVAAAEEQLGRVELDAEVLAAQVQRLGKIPKG